MLQRCRKMLNDSGYPRAEKEVVEKTKDGARGPGQSQRALSECPCRQELSEGQSLRSMGSKLASDFQAPKAKAKPKVRTLSEPSSCDFAKSCRSLCRLHHSRPASNRVSPANLARQTALLLSGGSGRFQNCCTFCNIRREV